MEGLLRMEALYNEEEASNKRGRGKKQSDDDRWKQRFHELQLYKQAQGNCNVPNNYPPNKSLGRWVSRQRDQYNLKQQGKHSYLTDDRIVQLETIGFCWRRLKLSPRVPWEQRFEELKEYLAKHGNCNVPRSYEPNRPLGTWVNDQRQQYRMKQEGKPSFMTDARIAELESIGFTWRVNSSTAVPPQVHSNSAAGDNPSEKRVQGEDAGSDNLKTAKDLLEKTKMTLSEKPPHMLMPPTVPEQVASQLHLAQGGDVIHGASPGMPNAPGNPLTLEEARLREERRRELDSCRNRIRDIDAQIARLHQPRQQNEVDGRLLHGLRGGPPLNGPLFNLGGQMERPDPYAAMAHQRQIARIQQEEQIQAEALLRRHRDFESSVVQRAKIERLRNLIELEDLLNTR